MSQKSGAARRPDQKGFTDKQGQYLAFIYTYAHMFRRPPAEADMQRHFRVSPPSVHQMVVTRVSPACPEASSSSLLPSSCPSWNGSKSTRQNHSAELLDRPQIPDW